MRRLLSFFLIISLLFVPSIAYSATGLYVPIVPEFLTVSSGRVTSNIEFNKTSSSAVSFFTDFYDSPYLIVLRQGTSTTYYPEVGSNAEYVGANKMWWVTFVKSKVKSGSFEFLYWQPTDNKNNRNASPFQLMHNGAQNQLDILSYLYDYENKCFIGSGTLQTNRDSVDFSYVIGSSATSGSSSFYPYFSSVGGIPITVTSSSSGTAPHYNWWIGKGDVVHVPVTPPIDPPVDPPIDPPVDPPVDPPYYPNPTPPNWDDIKPDNPFNPFDPDSNNDGYAPPPSSGYDPLPPNYSPPPMPEFPSSMPDFDEGGNDPFAPPSFDEGGNDPFAPPSFDEGGNDPFAPPSFDEGGNNPFAPPSFDEGGNNPFAPPSFDEGGNNPFAPPSFDEGGNNPFAPPSFDEGGNNPFAPPSFDEGGNNPFAPPSFDEGGYNPFSSTPKQSNPFSVSDWFMSFFKGVTFW